MKENNLNQLRPRASFKNKFDIVIILYYFFSMLFLLPNENNLLCVCSLMDIRILVA